jgi:hypothetical protein
MQYLEGLMPDLVEATVCKNWDRCAPGGDVVRGTQVRNAAC